MYFQSNKQKIFCKKITGSLLLASWRSMTKTAGSGSESGSISQKNGSADPDPGPYQNVMDQQHWFCCRWKLLTWRPRPPWAFARPGVPSHAGTAAPAPPAAAPSSPSTPSPASLWKRVYLQAAYERNFWCESGASFVVILILLPPRIQVRPDPYPIPVINGIADPDPSLGVTDPDLQYFISD